LAGRTAERARQRFEYAEAELRRFLESYQARDPVSEWLHRELMCELGEAKRDLEFAEAQQAEAMRKAG
jgi:hypothetical protein